MEIGSDARVEHKRACYILDEEDVHDEELKCRLCFEPPLSPVLLPCACELLVCRSACLLVHGNSEGQCPTCSEKWTLPQLREPPRLVLNMLARVKVRCVYCSSVLQRGVHGELYEQHYNESCPVKCPLECGLVFSRLSGMEHMAHCPNKKSECPAAALGCRFQGSLRELKDHEVKCVLSEVAPFLLSLQEENKRLRAVVEGLLDRVSVLEKRNLASPQPQLPLTAAAVLVAGSPSPSPSNGSHAALKRSKEWGASSDALPLSNGVNGSRKEGRSNSIAPNSPQTRVPQPGEHFTSVYVGNINFSATKAEISDRFCEFGPVESVKLFLDDNGNSIGKAYVNYLNAADAQSAMAMDQIKFQGRTLYVKPGPFRRQQ